MRSETTRADDWRFASDCPPPKTQMIYVKSIEIYRWSVSGRGIGRWQKFDGLGYVDAELPAGCEWLEVPNDDA